MINKYLTLLLLFSSCFLGFSQDMLDYNLLANGDAEIERTDQFTPGWFSSTEGDPQTETYGHTGGEFDWDWGKDKGYGNGYFRAVVMKIQPKYLSQVIDLGSISSSIDSTIISFTLAGYFGGGNEASTRLETVFMDKDGKIISKAGTMLLKDSEKPEPLDLYNRMVSGRVPKGTVKAEVFLRFEFTGECDNCSNMAVADNVSFLLTKINK
jgi:hypothetical protein